MPSDTPPGQALSSISHKRDSSTIGSCVGVLFQIFQGTRFFHRKSLPSERPKQDSINHNDDKLPIAKLLLIADENIGGLQEDEAQIALSVCSTTFTNSLVEREGLKEDEATKDEPCQGELPCRRAPSLLARLMGLDTMPPSKPAFSDGKSLDLHEDMALASANVAQETCTVLLKNRKKMESAWRHTSLCADRTIDSKRGQTEKYVAARPKAPQTSKKEVKGEVVREKVLSKHPSLPLHHLDSSYPSKVSASKGNNPINKDSICAKKPRTRYPFQEKPTLVEAKVKKLTSRATQDKRTQGMSEGRATKRQSTPLYPTGEHCRHQIDHGVPYQVRGRAKGSLHERGLAKRKQSHQQEFTQPKAHTAVKVQAERHRQEETSRRLSQLSVTSNSIKTRGSRVSGSSGKRLPSPPKSMVDSSRVHSSSQASNTTMFLSPSIPDLLQGKSTSEGDTSSFSTDGSSSSATTLSYHRSSMEGHLLIDQSLPDLTSCFEDFSDCLQGAMDITEGEGAQRIWKAGDSNVVEQKWALGTSICSLEEFLPSKYESVSGDSASTASSSPCMESDAHGIMCEQVLSYSAKNTAALLQELLTALGPSKSHQTLDDKVEDYSIADGVESCFLESNFIHSGGKPRFSTSGDILEDAFIEEGDEQRAMSSTDRPCQDSPFFAPSNSSRTSQGQTLLLSRTSISETQLDDGSLTSIDPHVIGLNLRAKICHRETELEGSESETSSHFLSSTEWAHYLDERLSSYYASSSAANDAESICRSEMELGLKNKCEKAAAQNKKLVSDCIDEAFKSLGKGSLLGPSSGATHVLRRVYTQIDEWKDMSITMNLDHMVEKEMEHVGSRWKDVSMEVEEVAEAIESAVFNILMEEALLEMI